MAKKISGSFLVILLGIFLIINFLAIFILLSSSNKDNKSITSKTTALIKQAAETPEKSLDSALETTPTPLSEETDIELTFLPERKKSSSSGGGSGGGGGNGGNGEKDSDNDGIADNTDNCPNVANPDQKDSDNDGAGDSCDKCPKDPDNDKDNDNVCGDVDNCPNVANPDQKDSDNDGIGDSCDSDEITTTLSFQPLEFNAGVNQEFNVSVLISTEKEIYAVEIKIMFNSNILEALEVKEGDFLKKDGVSTSFPTGVLIDNVNGMITIPDTRLVAQNGVSGQGTIAIIKFKAKSAGTTTLSINNVTLSDPNFQEISGIETVNSNIIVS